MHHQQSCVWPVGVCMGTGVVMTGVCNAVAAVNTRRNTRSNTTYVAFGARGDKVIASYHADHAYSFDITSAADNCLAAAFLTQSSAAPASAPSMQPLFTAAGFMPRVRPTDLYTRCASSCQHSGVLP